MRKSWNFEKSGAFPNFFEFEHLISHFSRANPIEDTWRVSHFVAVSFLPPAVCSFWKLVKALIFYAHPKQVFLQNSDFFTQKRKWLGMVEKKQRTCPVRLSFSLLSFHSIQYNKMYNKDMLNGPKFIHP